MTQLEVSAGSEQLCHAAKCPGCHTVLSPGKGIPTHQCSGSSSRAGTGNLRDFLVKEKLLHISQPGPVLLSPRHRPELPCANPEPPDPRTPPSATPHTAPGFFTAQEQNMALLENGNNQEKGIQSNLFFSFFLFFPTQAQ